MTPEELAMTRIESTRSARRQVLLTLAVGVVVSAAPAGAHDDLLAGLVVDPLVGVWESVSPGQIDCQTGEPLPDAPIIRAVYTIQHGGTMSEENTDPIEGPYRSSGSGIWKRTSGRQYVAAYQHYGFVDQNLMPGKQLGAMVKARTSIRLRADARAFAERGTFDVFFPDPVTGALGDPVFSGCFAATAHRVTF
jgi:hypothetical protein